MKKILRPIILIFILSYSVFFLYTFLQTLETFSFHEKVMVVLTIEPFFLVLAWVVPYGPGSPLKD